MPAKQDQITGSQISARKQRPTITVQELGGVEIPAMEPTDKKQLSFIGDRRKKIDLVRPLRRKQGQRQVQPVPYRGDRVDGDRSTMFGRILHDIKQCGDT